jgi:AcrR family transcriptional regulator
VSPRTKEQTARIREERRRQILDAARQVFSQKGLNATKVSDVAAAAGLSQGLVYHYFDSKDDLFMAVFEEWVASSTYSAYAEEVLAAASAADQLRAFARAASHMMAESAAFLPVQMGFWSRILHHEAIRERFRQFFAGLRTALAQIIRAGVESGEFRATDAETLAGIAIAVYDGLVLQWVADPAAVDWERATDILIETTLHGVLASPASELFPTSRED